MAVEIDSSTEYLRLGASLKNSAPNTMSFWFRFDVHEAEGVSKYLMGMGGSNVSSDSEGYFIYYTRTETPATNLIAVVVNGADSVFIAFLDLSNNTWYHVVFVNHSATSISLWVNGTESGPDTVTSTIPAPTGDEGTVLADFFWANPIAPIDGKVCEGAVWDIALSNASVASLYNSGNGARADSIAAANLLAYWRVSPNELTDPDYTEKNRPTNDFDHVGSPTLFAHPITTQPIVRIRHNFQQLGC